jgi:uncharacterized protein (TIGR03086 family)
MIDLEPATRRVTTVLRSIPDDQLVAPTPCPGTSVGDLIDHLSVFAASFIGSARKDAPRHGDAPTPAAANLGPDWRDRVAGELADLAEAWSDPSAWEGVSHAGAIELPAELAGLVALDELVVHGWDLATATGQPYTVTDEEAEAAASFIRGFDVPRDGSLFGPVVAVDGAARPLDRLLGLAGRDPSWRPPEGP